MKKCMATIIWLCLTARVFAGDYYVDVNAGSDENSGTREKPFRTIEKAKAVVRQDLQSGMTADITVFLRQGTYLLEKPLIFDPQDSGKNGFKVIYKGYPHEKVQLIGGREIKGWSVYQGDIYKASVGQGFVFANMMENEQLGVLARTPNEGYFAAAKGTATGSGETKSRLVFNPDDVKGTFNPKGVQVYIWAGQHKEWDGGKNWNWHTSILDAAQIHWDTQTIELEGWAHYTLYPRNRYYLRGAREFLDQPGEFFLDTEAGTLYYQPRQTPIENQRIIAARMVHLMEVCGSSIQDTAGNITFENLQLVLSDTLKMRIDESREANCNGMVFLKNAQNVTLRNCHLKNAGMSAIAMQGANQGHQIRDNLIEDVMYHGVCIWGYGLPDKEIADETVGYVNKGHEVYNNHIRNCGRLIGNGCGIEMVQAGDLDIAHNLIENIPRYAICVYSNVFSQMINGPNKGVVYGKQITWENHYDYLFTRNIHVHHNECRHVMQDSSDGGAINFYGVGTGNRIENNFVHDIKTVVTDGMIMGIYVDDHANGFVVKNNIVCRMTGAKYITPYMVKGHDNIISNNIAADNESSWGMVHVIQTPIEDFDFLPEGSTPEKAGNLTFEKNIFYRNTGPEIYVIFPMSEAMIKTSDYNLFFPERDYIVKLDWKPYPYSHWTSLYGGRYEAHSLMADPLFVDPDHMNFNLKPESPALKMGFEPIDQSQMGLIKK